MKMKPYTNIDEYIANFSPATQEILQKIRKIAKEILPEAEEGISYGIPTFKINGKYVVYFAGYENHISIYPIAKGSDSFNKKIEPYIAGKGTIKFPLNSPIPFELVKEIVEVNFAAFKERQKK